MSASTRRRSSPLLFRWCPLEQGFDYQGNPFAISSNKVITGTFDRGGTTGAATSVDANGRVFTPGYKSARWYHSYDSTTGLFLPRGVQLGGARTNIMPQSQDFTTTWTVVRATISANSTTAPDGTMTADTLVEDSTATNTHFVQNSVVGTVGATETLSVYAKQAGRTWLYLQLGNSHFAYFNLATGAVGTTGGAGIATTVTPAANGFYRCSVSGVRAVTQVNYILSSDGNGGITYTGTGIDSLYLWGAQLETGAFPSSYTPTTTAAVTRSADALSFAFNAIPQALTILADITEAGTAQQALNPYVFSIGKSDASTNPQAGIFGLTNGKYRGYHHNGTASVSSDTAATFAIGVRAELRLVIATDGAVTLGQSTDSAAEVVAAASAANTLSSAWGTPTTVAINTGGGFAVFRSLKIAAGVQTLAYMRAA